MHPYRTHRCSELREGNIGEKVRLSGWVHGKRDHGQLVFIDLRDYYGITQLVLNENSSLMGVVSKLRVESVITVEGTVLRRDDATANAKLDTGNIEVSIENISVDSQSDVVPLEVNSDREYSDELRLRYRFLDLRRTQMKHNITMRSQVMTYLRQLMIERGFLEFHTPILTASSPEGARDFVVPSRLQKGKFYALPQSPQIFKQLLMVSGFDRYFQIAPCFRDEDARADRSPGEFYQLDLEMSFVTQEDVLQLAEEILHLTFSKFADKPVDSLPFKRISYKDAMLHYGSDKPDLRNPLVIQDVTDLFANSGFSIFVKNIAKGMKVRAIPAPGAASMSRAFFDKKIQFAQSIGGSGLAYIIFDGGVAKGPIAKLLDEQVLSGIKERMGVQDGDVVFFACDHEKKAANIAGEVRKLLGEELSILEKDVFKFCWIVDFPFYERDPATGKIDFSHNPFSMPVGGMEALENQDPEDIISNQYDIVCNGIELSSGAIRNHRLDIMYKAFEIVGYAREDVDKNFTSMVQAFRYGAPPHGGIAPGFDRILMLLCGANNIRDVVAFPMSQNASDLLMGAPSELTPEQLRTLNIKLIKDNKDSKSS